MFQWVTDLFEVWFIPPPRKLSIRSKKCKECGRIYSNIDSAAICSDWDKVLGVNRNWS